MNMEKIEITHTPPPVQLVGGSGNAFAIIGACSKALKKAGLKEVAEEFTTKCFAASDYDEVLRLAMTYCDVS